VIAIAGNGTPLNVNEGAANSSIGVEVVGVLNFAHPWSKL